ncbi:Alpha/Beta hydrolase protein [Mycena sp. CBHHK59/15]|nr:Alpha/Beta hydrolase protein [Mycena sp. CBHHK59/15]
MDQVAALQDHELPGVVASTQRIFIPMMEEKRSQILAVSRRTFKYGDTDRHQLDIYYPSVVAAGQKTKVLFYIYGGGFVSGERILPAPADLAYANLGAYFASKGVITVIPDYRLVPHVVFPEPARDVRDAVEWVATHPEHLNFGPVTEPDVQAIAVLGHSAGAVHAFTMMVLPDLHSPFAQPNVGKLILSGGPYHFHPAGKASIPAAGIQYWGSSEEVEKKDPMGLLGSLTNDELRALPDLLLLEAELEPSLLKVVGKDFHEALLGHPEVNVKKIYMKGHNHISGSLALGTNEGEEWADEVLAWIRGT